MTTALRALLLSLFLVAGAAAAQSPEAEIRKILQQKFPQDGVESVTRTQMNGIYEVYADGKIFYTDDKGTFIIAGRMFDTRNWTDLTEERMRKLTAIKFDDIPLNLAFKRVRGNGSRKIAYFADPNCGYCKRFEKELVQLNDVTVYHFLYPILSDDSMVKSKSVWCSPDKLKAWDALMLNNTAPVAAPTCDTPIDKILDFGRRQRITGTPTVFFADGSRVPGAMSLAQLQKQLAQVSGGK